jgi:cytochrome P450
MPGGMAHAVLEDDESMGYRVPRGATVMASYWSLDLAEEAV